MSVSESIIRQEPRLQKNDDIEDIVVERDNDYLKQPINKIIIERLFQNKSIGDICNCKMTEFMYDLCSREYEDYEEFDKY
jgi:hypothetical protein